MSMQIAALVALVGLVIAVVVIGFMNSLAKPAAPHPPGGGGGHGHHELPWYQKELFGVPVAYAISMPLIGAGLYFGLDWYTPLNDYQVNMITFLVGLSYTLWYLEDSHKHGPTLKGTMGAWLLFVSSMFILEVFIVGWALTWMDHYPNSLNDVMYRWYCCRLMWIGSAIIVLHNRTPIPQSVIIGIALVIQIPVAAYVMYGWDNGFLQAIFKGDPIPPIVTWLLPM